MGMFGKPGGFVPYAAENFGCFILLQEYRGGGSPYAKAFFVCCGEGRSSDGNFD